MTKEAKIKQGIAKAFQLQFTDPRSWCPFILGIQFVTLERSEAAKMEGIFTEEEVLATLKDMNGDKAPGPDGFTVALWQSSWDIVEVKSWGCLETSLQLGNLSATSTPLSWFSSQRKGAQRRT